MNNFLSIMCFALVATATANPAYNYQPPQAPIAPAPQYAAPVQQQYAAPVQQQYAAPVQQQYATPAPQYLAPVQQQYAAPAPVAPAAQYHSSYQPQQQTIISKDIFIHSGPEETEEIGNDLGADGVGPNRKNYRIVFIKAPAQNLKLNLGSLKRAQASNEEKTVIYVLSKKPDLGNLQSQLAAVQPEQKAHKPEVHFIKYKTQDEANRAQQEIQAQYESLGGSTHISDEGIAPVTSVIGGGRVNVGSVGPGFTGGNSGLVGSSFAGINSGSAGSAFSADSSGSFGSVASTGNSFAGQQQQFGQQSFQSSHGSTSSSAGFGAALSQSYLPAHKK